MDLSVNGEVASLQCHILTGNDYALIFTNILYTFFYDTTTYFKYPLNILLNVVTDVQAG
jgi:hypothetical protein